jgi:hypothetical protein
MGAKGPFPVEAFVPPPPGRASAVAIRADTPTIVTPEGLFDSPGTPDQRLNPRLYFVASARLPTRRNRAPSFTCEVREHSSSPRRDGLRPVGLGINGAEVIP